MITTEEIKSRFERTSGGMFQGIDIITDKVTGVQYLVNDVSDKGGITPLIDKEGKPVLSSKIPSGKKDNPFQLD